MKRAFRKGNRGWKNSPNCHPLHHTLRLPLTNMKKTNFNLSRTISILLSAQINPFLDHFPLTNNSKNSLHYKLTISTPSTQSTCLEFLPRRKSITLNSNDPNPTHHSTKWIQKTSFTKNELYKTTQMLKYILTFSRSAKSAIDNTCQHKQSSTMRSPHFSFNTPNIDVETCDESRRGWKQVKMMFPWKRKENSSNLS